MRKQAYDRLTDLHQAAVDADLVLSRYRDELCRTEAPHKVGDRVQVNEYCYRGREMIIDRVSLVRRFARYEWLMQGRVIKKDSTPGGHKAESRYPVWRSA